MRHAIINNRNIFAANVAQFAEDEGIDGIDIDSEYPGVGSTISCVGSKNTNKSGPGHRDGWRDSWLENG